jgi:hypothetical protein
MRGHYLGGQTLGFDHRANTDFPKEEASAKDGDVRSAWAIAFVAVVLLGLLSTFA